MFPSLPARRTACAAIAAVALAPAGLALVMAADAGAHGSSQRLVVRGTSTVLDAPCPDGPCLQFDGGSFNGAPLGDGAYTGTMQVRVKEAFLNGEGGICAPVDGTIVLGAGTPDRLRLAVRGDSCQDGHGDPTTTAFTTLGRFRVVAATGRYAKATGHGVASFLEDAADHDRMTLIGRIST